MPISKYYNPFQREELRYPSQYREDVERFTQTRSDGGGSEPDSSPFPRYVDMWFLAVCLGAQMGKRTPVTREDSHRFIEGSIFQSDPWRVELLELLAIGFTGDPQVIKDPREVIHMANELAATGMPEVISMLQSSQDPAIWNLSSALVDDLERVYPEVEMPLEASEGQSPADPNLEALLKSGENKAVEFKSSLRYDYATKGANKSLVRDIAKTISAFLNTAGGTLIVGVNDNGEVLGVEKDLSTLGEKSNADGWELALRNGIRDLLPADVLPLIDVHFEDTDRGLVAMIRCEASPRSVFLTEGKTVSFFIRSGNSSQPLDVRATSDYIRTRWPNI